MKASSEPDQQPCHSDDAPSQSFVIGFSLLQYLCKTKQAWNATMREAYAMLWGQ